MSSVEGIQQTLYSDKVTPIDLIEVDDSSDSEESSHCFMSPHNKFPLVSTNVKTGKTKTYTVSELEKNRLSIKLASRRWRTRRKAALDELRREELTEEIKNDRYKVIIKKLEQAYEEALYIFEEVQKEKAKRRKKKSDSLDSGAWKLARRDTQVKTIDSFDRESLEDTKVKTIIKEKYLEEHERALEFVERGQQDIFGRKQSEEETVKKIKIETTPEESEDEIFIARDLHEKTRNDFDEEVLEEEVKEEVVIFKTEEELVEESENLQYLSRNVQGNNSHLEVQEEEENVVWLKAEKWQDDYGTLKCESDGFKVENVESLHKVLMEEEEIKSTVVEADIGESENLQYLSVNVQNSLEKSFLSDEVINISSSDSDSSNCSKPVHHDVPVPVCLLVNVNRKITSEKDIRRVRNKEASQRFRIRKKARLDNLLQEEMIELNKNKKYKTFIKQLEQVLQKLNHVP